MGVGGCGVGGAGWGCGSGAGDAGIGGGGVRGQGKAVDFIDPCKLLQDFSNTSDNPSFFDSMKHV